MGAEDVNNEYTIRIRAPLVRPGLEIETKVSEKYLVRALKMLFAKVREFNKGEEKPE